MAILGVLAFEPASGYEIQKLLSETTAHFWKESYGQIYPALELLLQEGLISVESRSSTGRETVRYRLLSPGLETLKEWIRSPEYVLKPGRNELLLKLFFARKTDATFLIPQVEQYMYEIKRTGKIYQDFLEEPVEEELTADAVKMIRCTIDFGLAASEMQIKWCERTLEMLTKMALNTEHS